MAGKDVIAAVFAALSNNGIELEDSGRDVLRSRLDETPDNPPPPGGVGEAVAFDSESLQEMAKDGARLLAEALRETGPGPYGRAEIDVTLRGLCPIWPFC